MEEAEVAHMIERGEIDEDQIFFHVQEDIEIPPDCDDLQAFLKNEASVLSDRLVVLKQAHLRFSLLSKVSYNSGLDFERHYRELYDDIVEHRDVWFGRIFNVDNPNPTRAEFATGILGTLCTILRQRGDLDGCAEVMGTYMAVLRRYQRMTEGCGRAAQVECCECLTYKANIIRINLGVQLRDRGMAVTAFREAVAFEKKEKALGRYDEENDPDMDGVMELFVGHTQYDEVPDDDIFGALVFMSTDRDGDAPPLELKSCGYCDKVETMHGDFKKCSRCHKQPYCSKKCQTKDWKVHKQLCGKKNTTNLDSDLLLHIAKQLAKNHTATVEVRTKRPLTELQKDEARAALVKKLKEMFTGDFSRYNSREAAADAGSDPSFCASLAEFFAGLPGYERVWGELRVGYGEALEARRRARLKTDRLAVPDDAIRDVCREVAGSLMMNIGFLLTDGKTSEMTDLKRHGRLVEELVLVVKKYIRGHRQFDSYIGLKNLIGDADFRTQMADVIAKVMGIEDDE